MVTRSKGGLGSVILALVSCSREPAPAPSPPAPGVVVAVPSTSAAPPPAATSPVTSAAATSSAPSPAALTQGAVLMFVGDALQECLELTASHEQVENFLLEGAKAEGAKANESTIACRGQTCVQATSGKPYQGACARAGAASGTQLLDYYYDSRTLQGTDSAMHECMKEGGSWTRNDSPAAQREALLQQSADVEKRLKRLGLH